MSRTTIIVPITKFDFTTAVDLSKVSESNKAFFVAHGLKQWFNDPYGSKEKFPVDAKTTAKVKELVGKQLERVYNGDVSARETDPVAVRARRIASELVSAAYKKQGLKLDRDNESSMKAFHALVAKHAATEKIVATAKRQLKAEAESMQGLEVEITL